jgi:hypothetical protein
LFDSDDADDVDDVPLLKIDNYQHDNASNDSDSILLNIDTQNQQNQQNQQITQNKQIKQNKQNKQIKQNKQLKFDMYSRNIIRFFLITLIMISFTLSFIIKGGIDYYNTDSDQILYGSNGKLLFKYYYIINFCQYIIFLLFSIYLILYIILCSGLCSPVRDIAFFNMLKINLGLFALNIIIKITYGVCLMFIINNNLETPITQIPIYYNYIIFEIIIYFIIQIVNIFFVNTINNLIDYYYAQ